jgi:hypothetical protein
MRVSKVPTTARIRTSVGRPVCTNKHIEGRGDVLFCPCVNAGVECARCSRLCIAYKHDSRTIAKGSRS